MNEQGAFSCLVLLVLILLCHSLCTLSDSVDHGLTSLGAQTKHPAELSHVNGACLGVFQSLQHHLSVVAQVEALVDVATLQDEPRVHAQGHLVGMFVILFLSLCTIFDSQNALAEHFDNIRSVQ